MLKKGLSILLVLVMVLTAFPLTGITSFAYDEECQHINTVIIDDYEPSCEDDGYTGDLMCEDCGEIIEYGEDIPAVGHVTEVEGDYEPTEDEPGYTGDLVCIYCGEIIEYGEEIPPTGGSGGSTVEGEWSYELLDNEAFITYYSGKETDITIPSEVDGYKVVGLKFFSVDSDHSLSITLPGSISQIDNYSIDSNMDSIVAINVSEANEFYSSVNGVLYNKSKTGLVIYPQGKTDTSYVIPDGVRYISYSAFSGNNHIKSITIPASIESIDIYPEIGTPFDFCSLLEEIIVSESNKFYSSVDGILFNKDKTEIIRYPERKVEFVYDIPDTVEEIGPNAFYDCSLLIDINLPNGLKKIGDSAFWGCIALKSLDIPYGVAVIESYALCNCQSLKSITIPDSVDSIGSYVFSGNNAYIMDEDNWENGAFYVGNYLIKVSEESIGEFRVKSGTLAIAGSAFMYCRSITSIVIPDGVKEIGEYAFWSCESLKSITMTNSVKELGYHCFIFCSNLENIVLSENIIDISSEDFKYTSYYNNEANWENGVLYLGSYLIEAKPEVTDCTIKNGTKRIACYAFGRCEKLTSATLPNGVTIIGDGAFCYCESLVKVIIPDSVTCIGADAFEECYNLTIYGYSDSYAETYANENDIKFGSLEKNGFIKVNGKYCYYKDGVKQTGWQNITRGDGKTYKHYFGTDGAMRTGWQNIKNSKGVSYRYYFGTNGCMVTGWQKIANSKGVKYTYYFHTNGVMLTGWQKIKNAKGVAYQYYFNPSNGVMLTGWQKIKNSKGVAYQYYFHTNGVMLTGWQNIKNSKGVAYKYYFGANGVMRTGWQWIANAKGVKYRYYFGTNGYMRTGWQNIKASNGKTYKYYFYNNGVNAINRNVKIGNKTYKFNKYGICTNA